MFGLSDKTIEKMHGVFKRYLEIDKVVIYGSRAKGNYRYGSDIDITLFGETLDYELLKQIDRMLDSLDMPYMIDISIYSKIGTKSLQEHIDRVGLVFYEKINPR